MDLPWLYGKVDWDWSRSSDQKRWAGRRIGWLGVGRGKKTKSSARLKSMDKKSSQPAANKQRPKSSTSILRTSDILRTSVVDVVVE